MDLLPGDVPDLEHQNLHIVEHSMPVIIGEGLRTHSDHPILGPSGEVFTVWVKAYAPNVRIARIVRRFIDQDAR